MSFSSTKLLMRQWFGPYLAMSSRLAALVRWCSSCASAFASARSHSSTSAVDSGTGSAYRNVSSPSDGGGGRRPPLEVADTRSNADERSGEEAKGVGREGTSVRSGREIRESSAAISRSRRLRSPARKRMNIQEKEGRKREAGKKEREVHQGQSRRPGRNLWHSEISYRADSSRPRHKKTYTAASQSQDPSSLTWQSRDRGRDKTRPKIPKLSYG
jgi:hypothetical protein